MLRYLLLLAIIMKLVKVWRAHVKSGEGHVGHVAGEAMGNKDALADSCVIM